MQSSPPSPRGESVKTSPRQIWITDFEGNQYDVSGSVADVTIIHGKAPLESPEGGQDLERNLLVQIAAHRDEIHRLQNLLKDKK